MAADVPLGMAADVLRGFLAMGRRQLVCAFAAHG